MEEELQRFILHKNGYVDKIKGPLPKKNPNIRGEKFGTLWLDGKILKKGSFPLLQKKKKDYCKTYGVIKEIAEKRFKITY